MLTIPKRQWIFAVLIYTIFFLLILSPLLLQHVEPVWDAADMGYPAVTYLTDSLREGRLPLWDPFTGCGFPFHAVPGGGTLDPLTFLIAFTCSNGLAGFVVYWLIYWWWAGIGMFFMAKSFGGSPSGALVAALTYSFSGFFIGHAEHTGFIVTAAWLPWIFTLADMAVKESNPALALLAGAAAGLCTFSGYPGLIGFMLLALLLWLLLHHLWPQSPSNAGGLSPRKRILWICGTLLIVTVIMLAVWSPILNSFFTEGSGYTDRVRTLAPDISNFTDMFSLPAAISIFFPFATILGFKNFIPSDISMTNAYMGMMTIPLAALWWLKGSAGRRPWWILIFVLFMFVVSLGGQAGLRTLLYYVYPPMRFMRFSAPFRIFWIMPLSLAGGLGFSYFVSHSETRGFFLKIFAGWAVAASAVAAYIVFELSGHGIPVNQFAPRLFLPGLVIIILSLLLIRYYSKSGKDLIGPSARVLLIAIVLADLAAAFHFNSLTVYTNENKDRYIESYHVKSTKFNGEPGPRIAGMPMAFANFQQVTKMPVVEGYVNMRSHGFNDVLCKSRFTEIMSRAPRFWLSPAVTSLSPDADALLLLSEVGYGEPVPVFVENAPSSVPGFRVIPGSYGQTRILSYSPENIKMSAYVPGIGGGYLASTERYAPGWKAWVDGVPQKIWRTNLFFRGMFLDSGQHYIVWKYEPALFIPLTILSYATLLGTFAAALFLLRRSFKAHS